jgi:hypothetical protein
VLNNLGSPHQLPCSGLPVGYRTLAPDWTSAAGRFWISGCALLALLINVLGLLWATEQPLEHRRTLWRAAEMI